MPEAATMLAPQERKDLERLETAIETGRQTFLVVGAALAEIRDRKLYRETHPTFDGYCQDRWQFSARRGRQLISAAEMGTMVPILNERQARVLALAPPDVQQAAWSTAVADGDTTARHLQELLQRDAAAQIAAVEAEERRALASRPATRPPRNTASPRDVVQRIVHHLNLVRKLLKHLPDIADQAEAELDVVRHTVESTTES